MKCCQGDVQQVVCISVMYYELVRHVLMCLPCMHPTTLCVMVCSGAFFELMMRKHDGFVIDGSHSGRFDRPSPHFFAPDNVHPWAQSYRYMAELVINFVQQVLLCPFVLNFAFASHSHER